MLQRLVHRGSSNTVRCRRAMMLPASAGGNTVPVIAHLVQADEDTVRELIHRFNRIGMACLDPRLTGGRPRLPSTDDEDFVIVPCLIDRLRCGVVTHTRPSSAVATATREHHGPRGSAPRRLPGSRGSSRERRRNRSPSPRAGGLGCPHERRTRHGAPDGTARGGRVRRGTAVLVRACWPAPGSPRPALCSLAGKRAARLYQLHSPAGLPLADQVPGASPAVRPG